jgi:ABC-2 type transport system permease protein
MKGNFDNTGRLVRFILRRERVSVIIWLAAIILMMAAMGPGIDTMFPEGEARESIAQMYDNPIMVGMMGPAYGVDSPTTGSIYAFMMLLWSVMAVAIMNIIMVVKHTRSDEEHGRAEVVRSLPVGRLANIHATMIAAGIINAILAVLLGLALVATGTEGMDFAGSMMCGAVMGAAGFVFAAITAVFCQLSFHSSGALGLSFLSLGVFYMLRGYGDVATIETADGGHISLEFLSLISPLGLAQRAKVFVDNDPIPVLVLLIAAAAIAALAYKLNSIRDLGQGFIPARPGRKEAKKSLLSPFGFSLRLTRNLIIIWTITMFALGASYGSFMGEIDQMVGDSPGYLMLMGIPEAVLEELTDYEKRDIIIDAFGSFVNVIMAVIALVPLIMLSLKLRSEEKLGRLEHILSRSVSRTKYLSGFVIIAFISSIVLQLCTALGLYAGVAAAAESNPFLLDKIILANLGFLPALWVVMGLAVLVNGLFPKVTGLVWGYYGLVCFLTLTSNVPDMPDWLANLSPFGFVQGVKVTNFDLADLFERLGMPAVSDGFNFLPLIIMTGIAAVLTIIGFITYRKRDMMTH